MSNQNNTGKVVFAHITIGLQLAITMLVFVYGGYKLDLYFDKSPLCLAIGTVIGMILGFYHLLKELSPKNEKNNKSGNEESNNKKRIKWN